jgi:hypothetical protein
VCAIVSDLHAGSKLGLCPPEGVSLGGTGFYVPGKAQKWLWQCWEDYWKEVKKTQVALKADLQVFFNGDAVDGDHHNTAEIISRNQEPTAQILSRIYDPVRALSPTHVFVIRGTEIHVGGEGSSEENWGKAIQACRCPESRSWSHWRLRHEIHGVRFDFQHHGRTGTRPWTKGAISALACEIFYEHAASGIPHPHFAIRSHKHNIADSYKDHPVRAIGTPAWQLKTAHGHRVVPESLADVGGIIITVQPDSGTNVKEVLFKPALSPIWKAA